MAFTHTLLLSARFFGWLATYDITFPLSPMTSKVVIQWREREDCGKNGIEWMPRRERLKNYRTERKPGGLRFKEKNQSKWILSLNGHFVSRAQHRGGRGRR